MAVHEGERKRAEKIRRVLRDRARKAAGHVATPPLSPKVRYTPTPAEIAAATAAIRATWDDEEHDRKAVDATLRRPGPVVIPGAERAAWCEAIEEHVASGAGEA